MTRRILSLAVAGAVITGALLATVSAHTTTAAPSAPTVSAHLTTPALGATTAAATAAPMKSYDFTLWTKYPGRVVPTLPVNNTKTVGVVTLIYNKLQNDTVVVWAVAGLPTSGRFFPQILEGACGSNGSKVSQLPDIVASSHGTGASTGIMSDTTFQGKQWHVSLYRKAGAVGLQRWAISCGNLY
jgi:hypothetical protein